MSETYTVELTALEIIVLRSSIAETNLDEDRALVASLYGEKLAEEVYDIDAGWHAYSKLGDALIEGGYEFDES